MILLGITQRIIIPNKREVPLSTIKRALISVSDKSGIVEFARRLCSLGVEIISTGGTAKLLAENGVPVVPIEKITGFPEMMDGRVKTLHPKIHGALLGIRDDHSHEAAAKKMDIQWIDLVVVNLYPFERTVARENVTLEEAIENIDIGGPAMLRSAAKNHRFVAVITDPADYEPVLQEIERKGEVLPETRRRLAAKVFERTADYDSAIDAFEEVGRFDAFPGWDSFFVIVFPIHHFCHEIRSH